jgi:hypothetical protein
MLLAFLLAGVSTAFSLPQAGSQARAEDRQTASAPALIPALSPYMDLHAHIDPHDPTGAVEAAARSLKVQNAARIFLLTEPYPQDDPERYDVDIYLAAAKKYPDKLSVVGGGGSLNAMIMESARTGDAGPEVLRKFRARAEELLREGAAGFGELTAEHLIQPSSGSKDYESAPPDHPLFLLLSDIAAENAVPIDLHMEAVPREMPLPSDLGPPNPSHLPANIPGFERLLQHNRKAKIIWAHAGADFTGYRTPDLCRQLLKAHSNLYMEIKYDPMTPGKNPVVEDGKIKPEWLKLFEDFPDRFVIGSDQHYRPNLAKGQPRWEATVLILNQLPPGLRQKIGIDNVLHIYTKLARTP